MFRILNHGPKFDECHHHCPWSPNGKLSRVDKRTLSVNGSIIHSKYFAVSDSAPILWLSFHNQPSLTIFGKCRLH